MTKPRADENLLLGILALQLNFINREQLIAATSAWVLDKNRPFDQVLVDQGVLAADTRSLLLALVEKHLALHAGDAEKSLAAVSSLGSARDELSQIADPQLQASLAHVPAGNPSDTDRWQTIAPNVGEVSRVGERFIILRPHAKGGLGQVSVARDRELGREVALKEIQTRWADNPASRARFLLEAEITGALEHPGIVPVYGLGTYGDGRPFYAMRFIQGDSLDAAIKAFHSGSPPAAATPYDHNLELRKLLGRFLDVCDAISYAHSRGVLHRDLKPGNIMLGKYGETLVVDWGLAKAQATSLETVDLSLSADAPLVPPSASGVSPTQLGSAIGTPEFMSPEQASGHLDQLGPASDVYSLGATLYMLLTGKPAFKHNDLGSLLAAVQRGEFPAPRQVAPQIPPALEAICVRAMTFAPEARYPSPRELADEIERWLADDSVSAYSEPALVRLRRWGRRHRAVVSSSAVLLVSSVVGLGAIVVAVKQQQLQTEQQRLVALAAEERASAEARRAEAQHALTLETLSSIVFDLQRQLAEVPGAQQVRRNLLNTALERLQQVSRNLQTSPQADRLTMVAMTDLGQSLSDLGAADLPDATAEARRLLEHAVKIGVALAAAEPANAQAQGDLAVAYSLLGDVSAQAGQMAAAKDHYEQSLQIRVRLAAADPKNVEAERDLAMSYLRLGMMSEEARQWEVANRYYEQALSNSQRLAAADPGNALMQQFLSISLNKLGNIRLQSGELSAAKNYYLQSLYLREQLASLDSTNFVSQRDLALSYNNLGDICLQAGQFEEARTYFERALQMNERLVAEDRSSVQAQRELSISYNKLGSLDELAGELTSAMKNYKEGLAIRERLAAADPTSATAQRDLSVSYEWLGNVSQRSGQLAAASDYYGRGQQISERLAAADPTHLPAQLALQSFCSKRGAVLKAERKFAAAAAEFRRSASILQSLLDSGELGANEKDTIQKIQQQIDECEAELKKAESSSSETKSK